MPLGCLWFGPARLPTPHVNNQQVEMNGAALLLVEDSPEDAKLIASALSRVVAADQVVHCPTGEDALDYLFARGRHAARVKEAMPRLVLLDLNLPRISGLEVLRQIRAAEATRLLPVIVLSASVEQRDVRAAVQRGANSYMRKSLDFVKLSESMALLARYWLELNIPPPSPNHLD